jgi:hypothetical protein
VTSKRKLLHLLLTAAIVATGLVTLTAGTASAHGSCSFTQGTPTTFPTGIKAQAKITCTDGHAHYFVLEHIWYCTGPTVGSCENRPRSEDYASCGQGKTCQKTQNYSYNGCGYWLAGANFEMNASDGSYVHGTPLFKNSGTPVHLCA